MNWSARIEKPVTALVTLSLILSLIGFANPAVAEDVPADIDVTTSESTNSLTPDLPSPADNSDAESAPESDTPAQSEPVDPPVVDEGTDLGENPDETTPEQPESADPPAGNDGTGSDDPSIDNVPDQTEPGTPSEDEAGTESSETTVENAPDTSLPEDPGADSGDDPESNATPDNVNQGSGAKLSAQNTHMGPLDASTSTVTVIVTMIDGGNIPAGLSAWVHADGDWTHLEDISLSAGGTTATATFTTDFTFGSYGVWVTGNGYSSGQSATFDQVTETYTFQLDRLTGSLAVTMNTSDLGDIPAGTIWTLTHADEGVIEQGTLASPLASGTPLPLSGNPLPFGTYQLSFAPGTGATGRQVVPKTITINLIKPSEPNLSAVVDLEIYTPMSTGTVSVTMQDDGPVPPGLQWSLVPSGSETPIASGPVTPGNVLFEHEIGVQVPYGEYALWVNGNGYSSGQVINVQSDTFAHTFDFQRLYGNLTVTVTTPDGSDIPAGTAWEILDANNMLVQNGVLTDALPSGSVLPVTNPFEFGVYTLNIGPASELMQPVSLADIPRELLLFTTTINITNPWFTEYPVSAELQFAVSNVTFTVSMADGQPLPHGLEWFLVASGSWDHLAGGSVTAGEMTFAGTIGETVPYGMYQLWVTGSGYSSGSVMNIKSNTSSQHIELERLYGNLTITVTTPDGSDLPAGSTWEIRDAAGVLVQSGILTDALPSGSVLPGMNPLEYGVYTLTIFPGADMLVPLSLADMPRELLPFSMTINITDPWANEYALDADIQWAESDVNFIVTMSDGQPLPHGLEWTLFESGSWDPLASGSVTAGEIAFTGNIGEPVPYGLYQLWISGNGYSSGQVLNVQSDTFSHGFELERLYGNLTITVTTPDGSDLPAGTTWEIRDVAGVMVQSGTLTDAVSSGTVLPVENPFEYGVYTLTIIPGADMLVPLSLADMPRELLPFSMTINITDPWASDYPITADMQFALSNVTFTVSMSDGEPLPNGLEWFLVEGGNWDHLAGGPVTAGEITFAGNVGEPVPYGTYQLWVTGNGYNSGQVISVDSDTTAHHFELDRLFGELTVTVTTSDGSDIPAGTVWEILDVNNVVIQSGTLSDALPSGSVLPVTNPFEFGVYTLNIGPAPDMLVPLALADIPRELLPFTTTINITNSWVSEYAVTADLRWAQSDVTFTVSMSDGEPLPNGLKWTFLPSGSEESLAGDAVTAGEISFAGSIGEPVPYGTYELRVTGNGYDSTQVLNISSLTTHQDIVLDRLLADISVVLDTSDDGVIPAGTTWSLIDSAGTTVQSDVLADSLVDGSNLPLSNPLQFDVYTLTVEAEGYHAATIEISIVTPEVSGTMFTVNLVSNVVPDPEPGPDQDPDDSTPDPSPDVSPEPSPDATPDVTPDATPDVTTPDTEPAQEVTGLPQTGSGEGISGTMLLLLAGAMMTLAAGILLRMRGRSIWM